MNVSRSEEEVEEQRVAKTLPQQDDSVSLLGQRDSHQPRTEYRTRALLWVFGTLLVLLAACTCLLAATVLHMSKLYPGDRGALGLGESSTLALEQQLFTEPLPSSLTPLDMSRALCHNKGILYESDPHCHCFDCYSGPLCETVIPLDNCTINADGGTPLIYEEYWLAHPEAVLHMKATDNMGYVPYKGALLPRLEAAIRGVHAQVGNAVLDGREIVIGTGSSEIIAAGLYALSGGTAAAVNRSHTPAQVYAQPPYYSAYPQVATSLGSHMYAWSNMTVDSLTAAASTLDVVEISCAPNNPDASMQRKTIPGSRALFDHAYMWPMFHPITEAVQYGPEDIAVFTLSKLTGHAGSRIGWAIVGDPQVADDMRAWIALNGHIAIESQTRAATLLEHVLGSQGEVIAFAQAEMQRRWAKLAEIGASNGRFKLQTLDPATLDSWSGNTLHPSPAYLWMQCTDTQHDPDCMAVLEGGGLLGRPGPAFGSDPSHMRLELLMRAETFDMMAEKLQRLSSA